MNSRLLCAFTAALLTCSAIAEEAPWLPLFPKDGIPEGWSVRRWDDVKQPADAGVHWLVKGGVLQGSDPRGTWLVSDREYGDFAIEFEWKLGERGNSGLGQRFPNAGDPAFDGLELQMVDPRYYPAGMKVPPNELTGGLYRALAPSEQVFKAEDWNHYKVTCKGSSITVVLNGKTIIEADLTKHDQTVERHDGSPASPLAQRPRRGRIGFQELSRGGGRVEIRNAKIQALD
ncbi:MAG: 3-keto-disaccharide hydrolase [Chthoniobacteraceae bacterium]